MNKLRKLWCYLFHNYLWLPTDDWKYFQCQACDNKVDYKNRF